MYISKHSIPLDNLQPPLRIHRSQFLSYAGADIREILGFIDEVYPDAASDEQIIPIFTYGTEFPPIEETLIPPYKIIEIDYAKLSPKTKQILGCTKPFTIVGCILFEGNLTNAEAIYALRYLWQATAESIPQLTDNRQFFFSLLFRSTNALQGNIRKPAMDVASPACVGTDEAPTLQWFVRMDPLGNTYKPILFLARAVAENGAAQCFFMPVVYFDTNSMPIGAQTGMTPIFSNDDHDIALQYIQYRLPLFWQYNQTRGNIVVYGISMFGFAPGAKTLEVGDSFRSVDSDGLFYVVLPVGRHSTKGLSTPFLFINSLLPPIERHIAQDLLLVPPNDNTLHVITFHNTFPHTCAGTATWFLTETP
jgi:hypothetical protein